MNICEEYLFCLANCKMIRKPSETQRVAHVWVVGILSLEKSILEIY
jgi:hypothetical protein